MKLKVFFGSMFDVILFPMKGYILIAKNSCILLLLGQDEEEKKQFTAENMLQIVLLLFRCDCFINSLMLILISGI